MLRAIQAIFLLLAMFVICPANATLATSVRCNLIYTPSEQFSTSGVVPVTNGCDLNESIAQNGSHASALAVATTSYGLLGAGAIGNFESSFTSAFAMSSWSDQVTISASGLDGRVGVATVAFITEGSNIMVSHGDGTMSVDISSSLVVSSSAIPGGILRDNFIASQSANRCTPCGINSSTTTFVGNNDPISFNFVFGQAFTLSAQLTASVQGNAFFAGDNWTGIADARHTAYWGGIGSVMLGGAPVSFDVASASGTDYRYSLLPSPTSVPEPASFALIVAGILMAGVRSRGRSGIVRK